MMKETSHERPPIFWNPIKKEPLHLTRELERKYIHLIKAAKDAKAFPDQSGFLVRSSASTKSGKIITGGNAEAGFSDTIVHGETSLHAIALALYGKSDPMDTICFYDLHSVENSYASPCGDCRDKTLYLWGRDVTFLQGNEKFMTVSKLSDYLFEAYKELEPFEIGSLDRTGQYEAKRALDLSITSYLPDKLKPLIYGAALVSANGKKWTAGLYTNAAYDSSSPVLNTVISWRFNNPDIHLSKLVIVGIDACPNVLYRDRQAFLELDESVSLATGRKESLPVEIISYESATGVIVGAWKTNSREWLPYPFSPKDFGMNDALMNQIKPLMLQ